jgi:deazaflavin-dependent oxidoreductase (nitroreductase family)
MTGKPYLRPRWAARTIGARMARLFRPSIVNLLAVPGRTTGEWRSVSVAVLQYDGRRYLMSAYGDSEWSRNLRAAGHGRLTSRGRTEPFRAVEVPVEERAPLIEEYLRQFGRLPTVGKSFATLPDPADHPTFQITSAPNGS